MSSMAVDPNERAPSAPSISIVIPGHFSTNPRAVKEADALAAAGFDVEMFGVRFDPVRAKLDDDFAAPRRWRYTVAADLLSPSAGRWQSVIHRARRKASHLLGSWGLPAPQALGLAMPRLLACAANRAANLTIVHYEPALWVGRELIRRGLPVGVDFEDWYSEGTAWRDVPAVRRTIAKLETTVLRAARHRTTTSHALSQALAEAYRMESPTVVYNSLMSGLPRAEGPEGDLRLFWFSQTIGEGRGLEMLCSALASIETGWTLTLLGRSSDAMRAKLRALLSEAAAPRIHFHDFVPPERLNDVVAEFDVGLALEGDDCRNHWLTASNKIFQYLQSGLYVLATNTAGQVEVLRELPQSGTAFKVHAAEELAACIRRCLIQKEKIRRERTERAEAADRRFGFEHSAKALVESVRKAVGAPASRATSCAS